MRRLTREDVLKLPRPKCDATTLIDYCLDRMIEDQKHFISWDFVAGCTYQDLINTLLKSRDTIEGLQS